HTEADLGRLLRLRIDQHKVRHVDRRLTPLYAALLAETAGLHVMRGDVDAGDNCPFRLGHDLRHLAAAALVDSGDHDDRVALSDARRHHSTSGASDMILVNLRARNSRTTGPKIRVPIGSIWRLISTAALRSKRIAEPSGRRTG